MECSGKREISGEVKKEWIASVSEWKDVERKEVEVVKKEEKLNELKVHLSKQTSFRMNDQTILCTEAGAAWFLYRELTSVWCFFIAIYLIFYLFFIFCV